MSQHGQAAERLGFIDALRGLSALVVVLSHSLPVSWSWLPHPDWLNLLGRACLIIFFVISGFFLPVTCEHVGSTGRFWLRRFFRLFPIYWLSIAVAFAIWSTGIRLHSAPPTGPTVGEWLLNVTMLQEFFHKPSVMYVYWTLEIELVIYLIFSILFALNLHQRTGWMVAGLLAFTAISGLIRVWRGGAFAVAGGRFVYFAPLMGLLAYRHVNGQSGRRLLFVLGAGQAMLLFGSWAIDHALGRARHVDDVIIFIHGVTWPIGYAGFFLGMRYRRYLTNAVLGWLGQISYSVYLLHMPVLSLLVLLHLPSAVYYPLLFAATLALSHVTFHWVEAPGIALGRAIEKRWLPRRTTAGPRELLPVAQAA